MAKYATLHGKSSLPHSPIFLYGPFLPDIQSNTSLRTESKQEYLQESGLNIGNQMT